MIANVSSTGNPDTPDQPFFQQPKSNPALLQRPTLGQLAQAESDLPAFVRNCPVAMKYLHLLGPLNWDNFPERDPTYPWPGPIPQPRAAYVAAFIIKLHEGKTYMSDLRGYLVEHPALVWLLGFRLQADDTAPYGFDVEASLPTARHFGRVLRELPNEVLQFLLTSTVQLLADELPPDVEFGDAISIPSTSLPGSKRTTPRVTLKNRFGSTKAASPMATPTANLAAKRSATAAPTRAKKRPPRPTNRLMLPTTQPLSPTSPPSMFTTGAMPPAWWPPKYPATANSCWPN
jgi:hypothetical protein